MKKLMTSVSVIAATAGGAFAGGLDRTGQSINALFEKGGETGSYFELSYANTAPDLSGDGLGDPRFGLPAGTSYTDVGKDFWNFGAAIKYQFSDKWSGALIFDQPYGADIEYGGDPSSTELGGTSAFANSNALTALLRYKFTDRWSAHGGLRIQSIEGEVGLSGLAYGPDEATAGALQVGTVNGYNVDLDRDTAVGYVLGAAYEIPDIALRVALTYNSEITHELDTVESGPNVFYPDPSVPGGVNYGSAALNGSSKTEIKTPQSVVLDLQTGIAEDTLLFGSVRWVDWSAFRIDPSLFTTYTNGGLVDLKDTTTYQIGIGRRFTEQWAGSIAFSYEDESDKLVSPLAPTNGLYALALGASYNVGDVTISGGARYTWLGDAYPETGTPDVARADFKDNTAVSLGLRIGYNF